MSKQLLSAALSVILVAGAPSFGSYRAFATVIAPKTLVAGPVTTGPSVVQIGLPAADFLPSSSASPALAVNHLAGLPAAVPAKAQQAPVSAVEALRRGVGEFSQAKTGDDQRAALDGVYIDSTKPVGDAVAVSGLAQSAASGLAPAAAARGEGIVARRADVSVDPKSQQAASLNEDARQRRFESYLKVTGAWLVLFFLVMNPLYSFGDSMRHRGIHNVFTDNFSNFGLGLPMIGVAHNFLQSVLSDLPPVKPWRHAPLWIVLAGFGLFNYWFEISYPFSRQSAPDWNDFYSGMAAVALYAAIAFLIEFRRGGRT